MGTWDHQTYPIMVNGNPLPVHIEKIEKKEKRLKQISKSIEIYKDNSKELAIINASRYRRPQFGSPDVSKKLNSSVKKFTISDQIDYLLKQNGQDALIGKFSSLGVSTRQRIESLVQFYRAIKLRDFVVSEVHDRLCDAGFKNIRQKLLLLEQAGLLKRVDNAVIRYIRIPMACEAAVIATMLVNAHKMKGFTNYRKKWERKQTITKSRIKPQSVIPKQLSLFGRSMVAMKMANPSASIEELANQYIAKLTNK